MYINTYIIIYISTYLHIYIFKPFQSIRESIYKETHRALPKNGAMASVNARVEIPKRTKSSTSDYQRDYNCCGVSCMV